MNHVPPSARSVFDHALEIDSPAQRQAYLSEACGGDAALRQKVDALLAAHEQAGSFLEVTQPALRRTVDDKAPPREAPGSVIGRFKVLEEIGEGGFGVVYMAEQLTPVRRKVALKVIKPGMDTRQVIARFEAERQALALMDHENIAKVLDAGATNSGRPYFVMELVHGVPITEHCDKHQIPPHERLELFVQVCRAVQHAHTKGVIHRDIKPTNVLVTSHEGVAVPKVIDFGIAKATGQQLTEETLFTNFAQMIGTPLYMSPEQAEMTGVDVDTRSDVYSLGVLLYELLTGSTPFDRERFKQAAYDEIRRIIREEDPPKPSTRLSESKASLPSISAQRQTKPAKLTKLVRGELDWIVMKALEKDRGRRYETANGFAADVQRYLADEPVLACPPTAGYRLGKFARRNKRSLTMLAVVTGAMLVLVGAVGWTVRDRAAREQQNAYDRATRQALTRERVSLALEDARKRYQQGRWKEALDAAKRADALAVTGESDQETRLRGREVLGDMLMLANLENVRVRSTQNEAGFDLKEEDSGYARAFREYGIDIDALDRDQAATRIRARSIRYELAVLLDSWSHVRRRLAQQGSKPTGKDWKELLEVARIADPDPWRDRFRSAVLNDDRKALVELAASAPISSLPAETVDRLGDALMSMGANEEAAAFLKKGQRLHPQDYWINGNLGLCLLRLRPQPLDDAIHYFTAAVALRPEAAQSHSNLADALNAQGKPDEAIDCYRKAVEIQPRSASAHRNLGRALVGQKKPDEAVAAFRKAIELDPKYATGYIHLGHALQGNNEMDEAVAVFRKAIELEPKATGNYVYLGNALKAQGKQGEAIACYRKAIELDPKYAPGYNSVGNALKGQGKLDEAVAAYRKAVELQPQAAVYHVNLAHALVGQNKLDEAVAAFRKAIELDPKSAPSYNNLAYALLGENKLDEAVAACRKAIELDPKYAPSYINLGHALLGQNKPDEAIAACRKAIELDPNSANAYSRLAHALLGQNKLDEATAAFRKAVELEPKVAGHHVNLGWVLLGQKKPDEAIAACRKAIELDPKYGTGYIHLGHALLGQKKLDEAVAAYRKATELHPKDASVHLYLGLALQENNEMDDAVAAFRKAIELDPKTAGYHVNLGAALISQKNLDQAVAAFRKAIELNPKAASVHFYLGLTLRESNKLDEAVAALRAAIELDPKSTPGYISLAQALLAQNKLDEAIATYRKGIERVPQDPKLHNFLARLLATCSEARYRDPSQSVVLARKAVELAPKDPDYANTLGVAHYRAGEWKAAIAALEKSTELRKGGNGFDWFFLAMAHWQLGNKDQALKWYDQAVAWMDKNQPNNWELGRFRTEAEELLRIAGK